MKLPNLEDTPAMILRGKRSAIGTARNDAAAELRDACTLVQGADWSELAAHAQRAKTAAENLQALAAMWAELSPRIPEAA
jgi:predicted alpha/beta-hydrolase family hydrolase